MYCEVLRCVVPKKFDIRRQEIFIECGYFDCGTSLQNSITEVMTDSLIIFMKNYFSNWKCIFTNN